MTSRFKSCWFLYFVLSLSLDGWALEKSASLNAPAKGLAHPNLQVHVLVYNYAQVSRENQAKAENRAGLIFREVGIELVWVENGSGSTSLDDIDLILRILPQPRPTLASQKALGEALPCGLSCL